MPDIRYIGKFGSADGQVFQARIHDSEFDGAAAEFPLQSVRKVAGRRGTHLFTPIRASSVELVGYKLTPSALDELLGADVGRFTLEIWRGASHASLDGGGGSRYWKGVVQTDLGEDDTVSPISNIQITATDGLSLLRTIPYMDTTGEDPEAFTGRRTHLAVIRECLGKIGYSLPVSVSARWYPDDGESGDILWEHAEVDDRAFYDNSGRPASCYEVLKQILYPYGGIMFWRDGRMVVIQKEQIGAGVYTLNQYDEAGIADGTAVYGATVDTATAHRLSGSRTYRTGYSSATVIYAHGNIPNLIEAGDFTGTPFLDPADVWDFGSSGGEIRKAGGRVLSPPRGVGRTPVPRVEYINVLFVPAFFYGTDTSVDAFRAAIKGSNRYGSQVGGEVRAGDIIAFSARFRIPFNTGGGDGLFNTFFELQIGSHADGYMNRVGEWYTPSGDNDLQPLRQNGSIWNTQGFQLSRDPGQGWNEVLIISEPSPVAGNVRLVLYGTADINGSDLDPEGVEWADIAILIVDENGELRDSLAFTATNGTPEPADENVVMLLGQGPHPGVPGHITWNGEDAENWTDGESTPGDHYPLLLRTRLGYYGRRLELRYERYDGIDYEMGDPLEIDGDAYDVVYNEKDLASLEDVVEAVRIRFVDHDITIAEVAQDQGTYVPGGTSTGVISSPSVTLPIQEHGDLIVGNVDGTPIRLDSGEDDGYVIVTDGEAEGGWALAPLTPILAKGDLIVGNSDGEPVRLPAPANGYIWVADSFQSLGWRAVKLDSSNEIQLDYLPNPNVHRWTTTAKAAKLSGSGSQDGFAWLITNFPDEMIDSNLSSAEVSGAPTLRAALDVDGVNQIPLDIMEFTPAAGGHGGGAKAFVWLNPGVYDGGQDLPITFFWITGGAQTQPDADEPYGSDAVYSGFAYWYHCEDDPSDGWLDATGNARHTTDAGTMTSGDEVAGVIGNGTDFDGSNDGMVVASPGFPVAGNDFTMGRWVKPRTDSGFPALGAMGQSNGGSLSGLFFDINESIDKFRFVVRDAAQTNDAAAVSTTTITYNTNFYFVVGRFDDSLFEAEIFINGASEHSDTGVGPRFTATGSEYIGVGRFAGANADSFNGIMDEPWRYDGYLTDDQIATMYQNQVDPADFWDATGLVEDGPF